VLLEAYHSYAILCVHTHVCMDIKNSAKISQANHAMVSGAN
jgi:hypothetical protein